jgi:nitrile hydratase accessory protein
LRPPELPGLPRDDAGEPVFPGAWQARAFALAALLNERGAFAWPDFAAALAAEIGRAPEAEYYASWLRALERLLAERGVAEPGAVAALAAAWQRAAAATPHGKPIRLENAGR